jgi:lipid II:glycine glycyltransferase (peptidoglycan interpeptide bridge formation enzyme)
MNERRMSERQMSETGAQVRRLDREQWQHAVATFADYSYRQSWAYSQKMAADSGAEAQYVAIEGGGQLLGAASVRVKRIPLIGGGIAYISGGPLVRRVGEEAPSSASMRRCLEALRERFADSERCVLRVQLPLCVGHTTRIQEDATSSGLRACETPRPYRTIAVSLGGTLEEIRARLQQKWRNQLNAAGRKGLSVACGTDGSFFERFERVFAEMLDRKGFESRVRPELFKDVQTTAVESDRTSVLLASEQGKDVAGIIVSFLGDSPVYLLGATATQGMQTKAAYLLQWEAVKIAKDRGARYYDLGGTDPESNPGVHHFKVGMGGADVCAPAQMEAGPGGLRESLAALGERTVRRYREYRASRSGAGA